MKVFLARFRIRGLANRAWGASREIKRKIIKKSKKRQFVCFPDKMDQNIMLIDSIFMLSYNKADRFNQSSKYLAGAQIRGVERVFS